MKLTKGKYTKKTEELLKDLELYRSSLEYYEEIRGCAELSIRQHNAIERKQKFLTRTLSAVERAMTKLNGTEREVVTELFFNGKEIDDVCEKCALERSSIYRYRASAMRKMAVALYGEE